MGAIQTKVGLVCSGEGFVAPGYEGDAGPKTKKVIWLTFSTVVYN